MRHLITKTISFLAFCLYASGVLAQPHWTSPELVQMYNNTLDYIRMANYKDAITTCRQALILVPDNVLFYNALGKALNMSGNYAEAEQSLIKSATIPAADTQSFILLAESQHAQQKEKKALATIEKGLLKFPGSRALFYNKGNILLSMKNKREAFYTWRTGIISDPGYAPNYRALAHLLWKREKTLDGILISEIYFNISHDTTGDATFKSDLFSNWKNYFDNIATDKVNSLEDNNFISAVSRIYTHLTPVISDGISTENLTMIRTRFLMEWLTTYNKQYPFPLFTYLNDMVANGRFDIYNEWLFGLAENADQFNSWNQFHDGDITRFNTWHEKHPFSQSGSNNSKILLEALEY